MLSRSGATRETQGLRSKALSLTPPGGNTKVPILYLSVPVYHHIDDPTFRATHVVPSQIVEIQMPTDRFIRDQECEKMSGLSRTTRWRLEREGKFPKRRQISPNGVGWLLSEIQSWLDSRKAA